MKNLVQILILLIFHFYGEAQNLIQNPSFEDIDSCYGQPAGIGFDVFEWSGCKGWSNPIASSSDLWCSNPIFGTLSPPNTGPIYQNPKSGYNYVGILENGGTIINYREYIQNELIHELENGKTYKLSFYYSMNFVECSMNTFQAIFRSAKMDDSSLLWLTQISPDCSTSEPRFIVDTIDWHYGEMLYKAKGGEKYMIFGNFQDTTIATYSLPCDTAFWGNISYAGNYFALDDFSLEELPMKYQLPNVFTPNNDGVNDSYFPEIINIPDWEMILLNRWGNVLVKLNSSRTYWGGEDALDGVYFYIFNSKNQNINEHGFFQLIR